MGRDRVVVNVLFGLRLTTLYSVCVLNLFHDIVKLKVENGTENKICAVMRYKALNGPPRGDIFFNSFFRSFQTSIQPVWVWRTHWLTRDGTAESVSRDQFLRRERGQGKIHIFPVQLTTRGIGSHTRLVHTLLKVLTIHIHNVKNGVNAPGTLQTPRGAKKTQKLAKNGTNAPGHLDLSI